MLHKNSLDEILINQIKTGDEKAFEKIYDKYWEVLFNYGFHRLRKREIVEGLVQEVFVNLWKEREHVSIHSSLIGFLKTCMKFKVLNQIKFQAVKDKYQHFLSYSHTFTCSDVEEGIWYTELQTAYARQVELLPQQAKKAYQLRMELGLSSIEIAKELQLSVSTVEKHLIKANRILRENLRRFHVLFFLLFDIYL